MQKIRTLSIANTIALVIHITLSYLSQIKVFGKYTNAEVSEKYPTYFTPAGITFAIWGLIYLSLIAFVIYHLYHAFKSSPDHTENIVVQKIGWLFVINNISTALWLFMFGNDLIGFSLLLMLVQLTTLIMIHVRLQIHDASQSQANKILTQFPLSIYFGWISIATIANASVFLKSIDWSGIGITEPAWAITMVAIAILITIWVINRKKNVVFGLVVIWALYGIMLKAKETATPSYEPIEMVSWGGIAIVSFACLFGLIRNLRTKRLRAEQP
jgi:hypothetical protein